MIRGESKKYDIYKDSGIDWLGAVPENWQVKRLKEIIIGSLNYGANETATDSNPDHPRFIRITDFSDNEELRDETFKSLPPDIAQKYLIQEGDILFARSGATAGKSFHFKNYQGKACYAGYLIKAKPNKKIVNSYFLSYYTKSGFYDNWKSLILIKSTIENISAEKYGFFLFVPLPSLQEQKAISNYLDSKTAQIDHQIDLLKQKADQYSQLKQSLINETVTRGLDKSVPMKDSGVEWIGEVPKHWEVKRIKDTTYVKGRIGWQGLRNEDFLFSGDYFCVTGTDLKNGVIDWSNCYYVDEDRYKQDLYIQLKLNDILITKDGTIGKVAIVDSLPLPATLNSGVFVTRPYKKSYLTRYMYWVYNSSQFTSYIDLTKGGSTIQHLYQNVFNRFIFTCPSLEEQGAISEYLDGKTQQIDNIILAINKQIEKYVELRKTLINDVVMGKIKVTEEV